jgi:hypothetical protein
MWRKVQPIRRLLEDEVKELAKRDRRLLSHLGTYIAYLDRVALTLAVGGYFLGLAWSLAAFVASGPGIANGAYIALTLAGIAAGLHLTSRYFRRQADRREAKDQD